MTYSWRFFEKFQYPSSRHISWEIRLPPPPPPLQYLHKSPQNIIKRKQAWMSIKHRQRKGPTSIHTLYTECPFMSSMAEWYWKIQFRFWQFQTGKFYHFSLQMGTEKRGRIVFYSFRISSFFVFKSRFFQYTFKQE